MELLAEKPVSAQEFKVKELFRADFGRSNIALAELSMIYRTEFGSAEPFKGARPRMTIQTKVLIETLTALGVEVRACPGGGPGLVDERLKAEEEFAQTGKLPDLGAVMNDMPSLGTFLLAAVNANDSITKSKWDGFNGCRLSLPDGPIGDKYVMIADKVGVGCGYGDVGKPFCAVKSVMGVLPEDVFGTADIFVHQYMRKMKNNAIVCNIGHFDNYFSMQGFEFKAWTDQWVFADTNISVIAANIAEECLMNLGFATDHQSFVMSCSHLLIPSECLEHSATISSGLMMFSSIIFLVMFSRLLYFYCFLQ